MFPKLFTLKYSPESLIAKFSKLSTILTSLEERTG